MEKNFIRMPVVSRSAIKPELMECITSRFIYDKEEFLTLASDLFGVIEALDDYSDKIEALQGMVSEFSEPEALEFFGSQNLALYVIESIENSAVDFDTIGSVLLKQFPILRIVDSDKVVMREAWDKVESFNDALYPLYCEPSEQTISHFLEHCPAIAFLEVDDDNWYAYLTTGGSVMVDEIVYAYIKVDGCVPHNYYSSYGYTSSTQNDVVKKGIAEFYI